MRDDVFTLPLCPPLVLVVALVLALALGGTPGRAAEAAPSDAPVVALRIDGAIGPATATLVERGLARAAERNAQLVVLEMDTPGGLDTSMRRIIQDVLGSPVPVAVFVAPGGARAASAGTYILYAAHVAAMAPATNIGAATPVAIGLPTPGGGATPAPAPPSASAASAGSAAGKHDPMEAKRVNDAVAYLRGLAQLRGRDAEWAERAVRDAASLPANDALERGVIDVVAADLPDLLRQLDGRELRPAAAVTPIRLSTAGARVERIEPDWRIRLLGHLSNPSLVLLLMMIGVYGLLFEFMSPGAVAPGVLGGVCLLLALWGLQMLPINVAGLGLVLLGIAFLVAEAFVPSFGVLGLGGVVALGFGALLLVDETVPGFGVPPAFAVTLALMSALAVAGLVGMAAKARGRPVVSGATRMLGRLAQVVEVDADGGYAFVEGERWRVRAARPLQVGQAVRIDRIDGLTLSVTPTGPPTGPVPTGETA
jgi:membrane-bound serine protease (ClpP class)